MKSRFLLLTAALGFLMTGCSYEEMNDHSALQSHHQVTAIIENEVISRSNATDEGLFTWSTGDEIGVYTSASDWAKGTLTSGSESASAIFSITYGNNQTADGFAVYPYNKSHSVSNDNLTINLPAVYDYSSQETYTANTNAPMIATITEDRPAEFNFKHVGAVIRFNVANVPAGASQFVFTATGKQITGDFAIDENGQIDVLDSDNDGTVTINFKALETTAESMKFFIPVPVGTYSGMTIEVKDADGNVLGTSSTDKKATIARKQLMLGPTLTITTGNIDNTVYADSPALLTAAIEKGKNVTLTTDLTLTDCITIPAENEITLDLNGHTLSYSSATAGDAMITNNGSLTIKNSATDGKITYSYSGEADTSYGKGNYTIFNNGTLTIENGVVENSTAAMTHASYAINTGAGATLTINGGKVLNPNGHAVRMVNFGSGANNMTVNGGYIEGTRAIQMQLPGSDSTSAPEMNLTINAGELKSNEATYNFAVYVYSGGQSGENVSINVTEGTINGNIALNGAVTTNMKAGAASVSGGTFNGSYGVFSYAKDEVSAEKISITGGTFATNYCEPHLAENYWFVEDNGAYTVTNDNTTVTVSTTGKLKEALAANIIENIKLLKDLTLTEGVTIPAEKVITLDLNGKTVSQKVECTKSYSMITNKGTLTITGNGIISFEDLSNGGSIDWGSYIIENHGTLTVENGTIEHLGTADNNFDTSIPIQNYTGKVIVNGGYIKSPEFRSLRDFTAGGEIEINGGKFDGQIWMQGLGNGSSKLTITGGEFSPTANDYSSIFVTNTTNDIQLQVTGGTFNTKIGCSDATKSGVSGSITGGTFTADAKTNTDESLIAIGYKFLENTDGTWDVVVQE